MNGIESVDFSIERGFRVFNLETVFFHFFMIQVQCLKAMLPDGPYEFRLKNRLGDPVYKKHIWIDSIHGRIVTKDSHEDPLVESQDKYMLCFQMEDTVLQQFKGRYVVELRNKTSMIGSIGLQDEIEYTFHYNQEVMSHLPDHYTIITREDCILRIHRGDDQGGYGEDEFEFKKNTPFNFKPYLKYSYVGLQCSYENFATEIEEKHIVVGQKGMTVTGEYREKTGVIFSALLPFARRYQTLYSECEVPRLMEEAYAFFVKELWKKVTSIEELLCQYSEETPVVFFETSVKFIEPQYRTVWTYGLNKVISSVKKGRCHLDLSVCKECKLNSKCLQVVPSGLSAELFKRNVGLYNEEACVVYQMIQSHLKEKH